MKDRQIKVGSVLSYVQMALNVVIGLMYTPLMIRLLGQSEYGLYNTVASTISMLTILNLGFSSGYIKYFSKYRVQKDQDSIYRLNGLFLGIFTIIGIIAFICGLFLSNHLDIVFDTGLTQAEMVKARTLMLLLTVNLAVSFPMSVFSNIITAHEQFIYLKLLGMIKTIATPLLTIPLLLLGKGSIAVVAVTLAVAVIVDAVNIFYVLKVLHNRFVFRNIERSIFIELFTYTSFIALNIIIDQINWNVDKFLLGRYRGTVAVAVYSVGATLQTYYQMFSTALAGIFTPSIHRIINSEKDIQQRNTEITSLFIRIGRIQYIILGLVCLEIIFFGKEFIRYWAGEGYEESYTVALLLIIPVTVPLIQNLGIEVQRALNKHKFRSFTYAVMAFINLLLSIQLCKLYGAPGSAIGTAISLILANGIIINIYYKKECGIDIILFWKNILRLSCGFIVPVFFAIFFRIAVPMDKFISVFIGIVAFACVYLLSMWMFGVNEVERAMMTAPLRWMNEKFRRK